MLSDTDELRHLAMAVLEKRIPGAFLSFHLRLMRRDAGEEPSAVHP